MAVLRAWHALVTDARHLMQTVAQRKDVQAPSPSDTRLLESGMNRLRQNPVIKEEAISIFELTEVLLESQKQRALLLLGGRQTQRPLLRILRVWNGPCGTTYAKSSFCKSM